MSEDFGRRDWELPCICGHLKYEHNFKPYTLWYKDLAYCFRCRDHGKPLERTNIHKFKLDNLSYVEQVARARGLV